MPLDPSIPLQVQSPQLPSLADIAARVQQIKSGQMQQEIQQQTIAANKQEMAQRQLAIDRTTATEEAWKSAFTTNANGVMTPDRAKLTQALASRGIDPTGVLKALDDVDDAVAKRKKSQLDVEAAQNDELAGLAYGIQQAGNHPEDFATAVQYLKANNSMVLDRLQPYIEAVKADPANVGKITSALISHSEKYTKIAQTDKAAGAKPKTGAELDARAQDLYTKKASGATLTPEETAELTGYEERKRVISDPTAAATADRQSIALAAQVAQQARAQHFAESQAGRKELTDKVEQPYLDALEKADTLKTVIAAAKGGNMEAASVQSLLGTLGLVTAEGVKRINTVELQNVAGAGNILERIKSEVGGLVSGQKLSTKLQDDLVELSKLLQQSAYKKYREGHTATTKRYELKDETPLPAPEDAPASAPAPTGGVKVGKYTVTVKP